MNNYRKSLEVNYNTINEIKQTFELLTIDKENKLYLEDLKIALISLGLKSSNDEVTRVSRQFKNLNNNRDYLNYEEFFDLYDHDSQKEHQKLYNNLTKDGSRLNQQYIKNLSIRFNEDLSELEVKQLLKAGDSDKDGEINERDFLKLLKRTNFN